MTDAKPKRRFRFLRFNLKTLLVFMLASGVFLGILIPAKQRAKRESEAAKAIAGIVDSNETTGQTQFYYNYQLGEERNLPGKTWLAKTPAPYQPAPNPTPGWIRNLLGEHTFAPVKRIDFPSFGSRDYSEVGGHLVAFRDIETLQTGSCFSRTQNLNCLKKMKRLRKLNIQDGGELESLDGIEQCKKLQWLRLRLCRSLDSSAALASLKNLTEARFDYCYEITSLESLAGHKGLRQLEIRNAMKLRSLDFLSRLDQLETLKVEHTPLIRSFDFRLIGQNSKLKKLTIGSFNHLENLRMLGDFTNLEEFRLDYTDQEFSLAKLPFNTETLKKLTLHCCHGLKTLEGIERLSNLEELEINWCSQLYDLEALTSLPRLRKLSLRNLQTESMPKLTDFPALDHLEINCLLELKDLDNIAGLNAPGLANVWIENCPRLESVTGLSSQHPAREIRFRKCFQVSKTELELLRNSLKATQITIR